MVRFVAQVLQERLERTTSDAQESEQDNALLELAEEEQMQAMMAFLWSWPVPPAARDTCCETHYVLRLARETWP